MSVDRRTVLKATATVAAAGPFAGLVAAPAEARKPPRPAELVPVPDKRDGLVRLHLPRGFNYRSFHDTDLPAGQSVVRSQQEAAERKKEDQRNTQCVKPGFVVGVGSIEVRDVSDYHR